MDVNAVHQTNEERVKATTWTKKTGDAATGESQIWPWAKACTTEDCEEHWAPEEDP